LKVTDQDNVFGASCQRGFVCADVCDELQHLEFEFFFADQKVADFGSVLQTVVAQVATVSWN
jgi:hypothetical protein